jgi:antitoxin (DNA-binding transcriptional repressor) of toxin-antitoxin stability system
MSVSVLERGDSVDERGRCSHRRGPSGTWTPIWSRRATEAGTQFTITVRGRAVATLGPATEITVPRTEVDARTIAQLLRQTPVDDGFADDLRQLRELEMPIEDPWPTK